MGWITHSIKDVWKFSRSYFFSLIFFISILILPNVILLFTEPYSLVTKVISIILPLSIYLIILSLRQNIGKMALFMLPIMFYGAFQIVIISLFSGSYIAVDMFTNLFTTTASEAGELLGSLSATITFVVVVYGGMLAGSIVNLKFGQRGIYNIRNVIRRFATIMLLVAVALITYQQSANPQFKLTEQVFPFNAIENTFISFKREIQKHKYFESSKDFKFDAVRSDSTSSEREVYVLIIGETSRAANFSLYGYERKTNPKLEKQKNLVVVSDVISQANTTHKIVPLILSATPSSDFNEIYNQKSITTAFKEVDFGTYFLSNQPPNGSFTDFFSQEADSIMYISEKYEKGNRYDSHLLPELQKALTETDKNLFIVLHTYGSHFNYSERYPKDSRVFENDNTDKLSSKSRGQLINAYDNTILYIDSFISEVISMVDSLNVNSSVLYISDHGEDIYDDQTDLFLHASPLPTYYQLHVPYMAWFSDKYVDAHPKKYENFVANKDIPQSSEDVFHTIIDIASIRTPYFDKTRSAVGREFTQKERYFVNDRNKAVPFYNAGLKPNDFDMLNRKGIEYDTTKLVEVIY